jgi:hypothetical protein
MIPAILWEAPPVVIVAFRGLLMVVYLENGAPAGIASRNIGSVVATWTNETISGGGNGSFGRRSLPEWL